MALELSKEFLLNKLKDFKKDADVIVLKQLSQGYVGITAKDFAEMLKWIREGKVVEEKVVGFAEDGTPIVQRTERDPTPEEVKKRWQDSGYVEFFEDWLSKGFIKAAELKALFGSERPWL